jgi:hypothetical protein
MTMGKITSEAFTNFVIKRGDIKVVDFTGTKRMIQPNLPNALDLVERADRFWFHGRSYTREGFAKLFNVSAPNEL